MSPVGTRTTGETPPSRTPDSRRRLRDRVRSIPGVIWAITVLHLFLLFGHSVLLPTFRAPDEHGHVDAVLRQRQEFGYPNYDEAYYTAQIVESLPLAGYDRAGQNLRSEQALPRDERPSFPEIAGTEEIREHQSLLATHPPLYYAAVASVTTFVASFSPGADWAFDEAVGAMRLLNVLMIAPLPLIAYGIVRRLRWSFPIAVAAALAPLAVPMLTNIGATVNNDNGLTLLGSILLLLLITAATGDGSRKLALTIGVVGGLALLTKGFALALPVWFLAAYGAALSAGMARAMAVRRFAQALGIALLVGGWWWLRNIVVFGAIQPGAALEPRPPAPAGFVPDAVYWLGRFASWMMDRFWGSFGRVDVTLDWTIVLAATIVLGLGVLLAFVRGGRPFRRWHLLFLLLPAVTITGIVAYGAYGAYERLAEPVAFHGRYLFPGILGLATLVTAGFGFALRRWVALLPALLLAAVVVMQTFAAQIMMPHYWGAIDATLGERVEALLAWAPWPPVVVVGAFIAGCLAAGWVAWEVLRIAARSRPSADAPETVSRDLAQVP